MLATTNENKVTENSPNKQRQRDAPIGAKPTIFFLNDTIRENGKHEKCKYVLLCMTKKDAEQARKRGLKAVGLNPAQLPTYEEICTIAHCAENIIVMCDSSTEKRAAQIANKYNLPVCLPEDCEGKNGSIAAYLTVSDRKDIVKELDRSLRQWRTKNGISISVENGRYLKPKKTGEDEDGKPIFTNIVLANFVLQGEGFIHGEESYAMMSILTQGRKIPMLLPANAFNEPKAIQRELSKEKCYFTKAITSNDALTIQMLSNSFTKEHQSIEKLGQHDGYFALNNAIVTTNGTVIYANEQGIVNATIGSHFISSASNYKQFKSYKQEPAFGYSYKADSKIDASTYLGLFIGAYNKEKAYSGFAFAVASLFYDTIFKRLKYFLLYNGYGIKGSGKTSFTRAMLSVMGCYTPNGVATNLQNITPVALARLGGQTNNLVLVCDEYKDDDSKENNKIKETLKAMADGYGRTMGKKTNDNQTQTNPITRPTMFFGEQAPRSNPALLSRCLSMQFYKKEFDSKNKEYKECLEKELGLGVGGVLVELLSYRKAIEQHFFEFHSKNEKWLRDAATKELGTEPEHRVCLNFSILLTVMEVLIDAGFVFPKGHDFIEFSEVIFKLMIGQIEMEKSNEDTAVFWEYLQYMLGEETKCGLKEGIDYAFGEDKIFLKSRVLTEYRAYYHQKNKCLPIGQNILKSYLKGESYYLPIERTTSGFGKQTRVLAFDMEMLKELELFEYSPNASTININ